MATAAPGVARHARNSEAGAVVLRVADVEKGFGRGVWPRRRRTEVLRGASLEVRATALFVTVALAVTALFFTPAAWLPLIAAAILTGLIYAALGALAGAILDDLAATYLMLFLVMTDLGIVQNPMFGSSVPGRWAPLLPGYGPVRMMVDGAFSSTFQATTGLLLALGWLSVLALTVYFVLRRAVGART